VKPRTQESYIFSRPLPLADEVTYKSALAPEALTTFVHFNT